MQTTVELVSCHLTCIALQVGQKWKRYEINKAQHDETNKMTCVPSLISVFAVCIKRPWVLGYSFSAKWRLWSDWVDAQADLSLRFTGHFVGFVMLWLKPSYHLQAGFGFLRCGPSARWFLFEICFQSTTWENGCSGIKLISYYYFMTFSPFPRANRLSQGTQRELYILRFLAKLAASWENLLMPYANYKGTDRSLISAFVVRCLDSIIPTC